MLSKSTYVSIFLVMTSTTVTSKRVSDGQWHVFKWIRYRKLFQLFLDNTYQADMVASGSQMSLNLQVGGKVTVMMSSSGIIFMVFFLQILDKYAVLQLFT